MTDIHTNLRQIRRPRLLISAARFGLRDYDRATILSRLFGLNVPRPGRACLERLLELETDLDGARRRGGTAYSVSRHVEILMALMAESRALETEV